MDANNEEWKGIKAGADIHAGDGGYGIGTQENYEAFVATRNKSLRQARIKQLAIQAGGGMSSIGEPLEHPWKFSEAQLEKFVDLVVSECADYITEYYPHSRYEAFYMKKHFGVQ